MTTVDGRTFDCRPSADPRNAAHRFAAAPLNLTNKRWYGPRVRTDQGSEGACVGFGCTNELLSSPVRVVLPGMKGLKAERTAIANRYASGVYHAAQEVDEYPGTDYSGTSVNAGAKVLRARLVRGRYVSHPETVTRPAPSYDSPHEFRHTGCAATGSSSGTRWVNCWPARAGNGPTSARREAPTMTVDSHEALYRQACAVDDGPWWIAHEHPDQHYDRWCIIDFTCPGCLEQMRRYADADPTRLVRLAPSTPGGAVRLVTMADAYTDATTS